MTTQLRLDGTMQIPLGPLVPPPSVGARVAFRPGEYVCLRHSQAWAVVGVWDGSVYLPMCARCEAKR